MQNVIQYCRTNPGVATFLGVLASCVVILALALVSFRKPDFALVLATPQDCLRISDAATCKSAVENALSLHARSAPRFVEQADCEFRFGEGTCRDVEWAGTTWYVPNIAVIVAVRDAIADARAVLPLYAGPQSATGRSAGADMRVFYKGDAVGLLSSKRFGGANMSILVDLKGEPLTNEWVRRKRRS